MNMLSSFAILKGSSNPLVTGIHDEITQDRIKETNNEEVALQDGANNFPAADSPETAPQISRHRNQALSSVREFEGQARDNVHEAFVNAQQATPEAINAEMQDATTDGELDQTEAQFHSLREQVQGVADAAKSEREVFRLKRRPPPGTMGYMKSKSVFWLSMWALIGVEAMGTGFALADVQTRGGFLGAYGIGLLLSLILVFGGLFSGCVGLRNLLFKVRVKRTVAWFATLIPVVLAFVTLLWVSEYRRRAETEVEPEFTDLSIFRSPLDVFADFASITDWALFLFGVGVFIYALLRGAGILPSVYSRFPEYANLDRTYQAAEAEAGEVEDDLLGAIDAKVAERTEQLKALLEQSAQCMKKVQGFHSHAISQLGLLKTSADNEYGRLRFLENQYYTLNLQARTEPTPPSFFQYLPSADFALGEQDLTHIVEVEKNAKGLHQANVETVAQLLTRLNQRRGEIYARLKRETKEIRAAAHQNTPFEEAAE